MNSGYTSELRHLNFTIIGNWKMNGSLADARIYSEKLDNFFREKKLRSQVVVCPPYIYLAETHGHFKKGGQDCSENENGAFTGEVSAEMLSEMGCGYVILGHSERREMAETSKQIAKKAEIAHKYNLKTVICVGEKDGEDFVEVVKEQLDKSLAISCDPRNTVIAYEPVWAIGTGKTPTLKQIEERHAYIKENCKFPVLYGGSVKPENSGLISKVPNVDGLLVGGASLEAESFISIINECENK